MKINSSIPSPATPLKARDQAASSASSASSAATTPASSAPGDASVSMHLQQATTQGAAAPFDSQRVAEIRQAITEGHFKIDPEKIASRLIDDVRDLLAKDRPTA